MQSIQKIDEKPRMSEKEIILFENTLMGCDNFLEYGCGSSTKFALSFGISRIFSVDSSRSWIENLSSDKRIHANIIKGRLHFIYIDIGPTGDWGYPTDKSRQESWIEYSRQPWLQLRRLGVCPDVVLVDGRFRVACFLRSLIAYLDAGQAESMKILLHDVRDDRPAYRIPFEFCDILEQADSLVLLRPKININKMKVLEFYQQFLLVPG